MAPLVASEIVTDCELVYVPAAGLNVGVATGIWLFEPLPDPPHPAIPRNTRRTPLATARPQRRVLSRTAHTIESASMAPIARTLGVLHWTKRSGRTAGGAVPDAGA